MIVARVKEILVYPAMTDWTFFIQSFQILYSVSFFSWDYIINLWQEQENITLRATDLPSIYVSRTFLLFYQSSIQGQYILEQEWQKWLRPDPTPWNFMGAIPFSLVVWGLGSGPTSTHSPAEANACKRALTSQPETLQIWHLWDWSWKQLKSRFSYVILMQWHMYINSYVVMELHAQWSDFS